MGRAMVARAARTPKVSFQGRSACTRGQVEVGMGAGGAGPSPLYRWEKRGSLSKVRVLLWHDEDWKHMSVFVCFS